MASSSQPWDGTPLATGTRIAIKSSRYDFSDGMQGWAGDFATPAGLALQSVSFAGVTYPNVLVFDEAISGLGAQFTIETWPAAPGEYFETSPYMKCILQADNGQYLNAGQAGWLSATVERDAAPVLVLARDGDAHVLYWVGYEFANRAEFDPSLGTSQQNGSMTFTALGAPPTIPYILAFIQGYCTLEVTVVGTDDLT